MLYDYIYYNGYSLPVKFIVLIGIPLPIVNVYIYIIYNIILNIIKKILNMVLQINPIRVIIIHITASYCSIGFLLFS